METVNFTAELNGLLVIVLFGSLILNAIGMVYLFSGSYENKCSDEEEDEDVYIDDDGTEEEYYCG